MEPKSKQRRPRISTGVLVASSNQECYLTIKAFKRVDKVIVKTFNTLNYNTTNIKFLNT